MNTYPKLKFQLNIELDIDIGSHFIELPKSGIDFGQEKVIDLYPELSKVKEESTSDKRKIVIANFTKKYYSEHEIDLENKNKTINGEWESVSEGYFSGSTQYSAIVAGHKETIFVTYLFSTVIQDF